MRVPISWISDYVDPGVSAEELADRLTMGGLEVEGIEESDIGPVLNVYVTPNRGDCLSIVGVAREAAALCGRPLTPPVPPSSLPGGDAAALATVRIEAPHQCPRFAARIIRGVPGGESPAWMQQRLEAAGMRPVMLAVDVTNYVMLELGQPLHAYDYDNLRGHTVIARTAGAGETLRTLDGAERPVPVGTLLIADGERPIGVAGVMGGEDTEVTGSTRNILLEAAHFDALAVRRASRALGLRTEASYRFERNVDVEGVMTALDRACELIAVCSGGAAEIVDGAIDERPVPAARREVSLRPARASALLGVDEVDEAACRSALGRLGMDVGGGGGRLVVTVPSYRPDIVQEEDLIEEVGRIHGYEAIPERLPVGAVSRGGESDLGQELEGFRAALTGAGLQEVVAHSLAPAPPADSPEAAALRVHVRNALSAEVATLRGSLLPGLVDIAQRNAVRGVASLGVFEIGRVWRADDDGEPVEMIAVAGLAVGPSRPPTWVRGDEGAPADYFSARGFAAMLAPDIEAILDGRLPLGAGPVQSPGWFQEGRWAACRLAGRAVGVVGELHPSLRGAIRDRVALFEFAAEPLAAARTAAAFAPIPRYPSVVRDLAPRVTEATPWADIEACLRRAAPAILERLALADVYSGPPLDSGVRSLTVSLTFRAADRTLSDAEVEEALTVMRDALTSECGAAFAS